MSGLAQNVFQTRDKSFDERAGQAKDLLLIVLVRDDNQNAVFNL